MRTDRDISVILGDYNVHIEHRQRARATVALEDKYLTRIRQEAISAVKNGDSTGDKLRDAIIAVIGYTGVSIERHLRMCLKERGILIPEASSEIIFTTEELTDIESFRNMPDLSLPHETINLLARVFGIDEPAVTRSEMDLLFPCVRVEHKSELVTLDEWKKNHSEVPE